MEKAYLFLRKLLILTLNVLVLFAINSIIPFYYSIPVLLIVFALLTSRITNTSPKELYNFQRSEKYFALGGLRDLIRIPVMLFAFIHDVIVWILWGIYQILLLFSDFLYFIKELIFLILQGIIWFIKLLVPFWRIVYKMFIYYLIKWPWWIYRYSFKAIKKTYNWNILKTATIGSFIALFIIHLFFFFSISRDYYELYFIGLILALLPITWVFAEVASIRGQNLMKVPFSEVWYKLRNGLESVRGLLVFITFFVVVVFAEIAIAFLGYMPHTGIVFLGFSLNISYLFNLVLIFFAILIVFGTFVIPTYRLYNEFNETSFSNIYSLLTQIFKRSLQYLAGFLPSSFFAAIAIVPISILVVIAMFFTMEIKETVINARIDKLLFEQSNAQTQVEDYKIGKEIDRMEYTIAFPRQFFQDINHRELLKKEIAHYNNLKRQKELYLANLLTQTRDNVKVLTNTLTTEKEKSVINQTRIEETEQNIALIENHYNNSESETNAALGLLEVDIEYATRQYKQTPILFYLSGLFIVVLLSFVFAFLLAYYGNYFYRTFLFKNDGTPAKWRVFIKDEQVIDKKQPLLSTSLNAVVVLIIIALIIYGIPKVILPL